VEWEAVDLAAFDRAGRYKLLTGSVIPRPIAWVTTCMPDGRTNLAPYSQFIIISTEPGLLGFSIGGRPDGPKDTLAHLEREGEMVINTAPEDCAVVIQQTSRDFGASTSEVEQLGLTTVPSIKVKPPRLVRSQIQFECRLERLIPLGGSVLVVGHVLLMHVASGLRDVANHIDHMRYRPLGRIGGRRYVKLTEIIDV
jgi:flavin reductase (DIM6/NTAB) family NADH-FMN oxidoreductase RutF